jgi:dTDP-4-dehydrorhamnose reductase
MPSQIAEKPLRLVKNRFMSRLHQYFVRYHRRKGDRAAQFIPFSEQKNASDSPACGTGGDAVADSGLAAVDDRGYYGILHLANAGSRRNMRSTRSIAVTPLGIPLKARNVVTLKLADMKNWVARRPVYLVLSTAKYSALTNISPRSWRDTVAEYVREYLKAET